MNLGALPLVGGFASKLGPWALGVEGVGLGASALEPWARSSGNESLADILNTVGQFSLLRQLGTMTGLASGPSNPFSQASSVASMFLPSGGMGLMQAARMALPIGAQAMSAFGGMPMQQPTAPETMPPEDPGMNQGTFQEAQKQYLLEMLGGAQASADNRMRMALANQASHQADVRNMVGQYPEFVGQAARMARPEWLGDPWQRYQENRAGI